jgi:hypothetical protein
VLVGEDVLVEEVGAGPGEASELGVEGDEEAGVEVGAERVAGERRTTSGADVGGDVDLHGNLLFGEDWGSCCRFLPTRSSSHSHRS